jgi:hypothetical protein
MIKNIFEPDTLAGPLKVYGTSKPSKVIDEYFGWFYPLFTTRKEALQFDLDSGGKGIYQVITFYNVDGEFYVPESTGKYAELKDPLIYTLYTGPGAENPFSKIQNKLSILVQDQLPDFVQTDYSMFITFIKAYYEFLEQNNQAQELLQNINKYANIDETSEEMISLFLKNYAYNLTTSTKSDTRFLIKRIREIYSRKGTETAYRILFNILYKETIDFFYPYDLILAASAGDWSTQKSLRVIQSSIQQNIFDFENTEIKGITSGATAIVNKVQQIDLGGYDVFELFLDEKSVAGKFLGSEEISSIKSISLNGTVRKSNLLAKLYSVISTIDIIDGKLGYKKDHLIESIVDSTGILAKAKVNDVNLYGTITSISIEESGINYSSNIQIIPGSPTESKFGNYSIKRGVVTINFPNEHGIKKGTVINVNYVGNVLSPLNNSSHNISIVSIPNKKSIRYLYPGY